MTEEMIKDPSYTVDDYKDDKCFVFDYILGRMHSKANTTQFDDHKELLEYFIDLAEIEIEDRYQKRKK